MRRHMHRCCSFRPPLSPLLLCFQFDSIAEYRLGPAFNISARDTNLRRQSNVNVHR